ncbi:MAG: permease-like cell division protein FtsX [Oscillospiraceae bacterium]
MAEWEENVRGSSFNYLIKEGVRNIRQNRLIALAAIGVLVSCLLLVGASVLFSLNINSMVGYFETQNEAVAFLEDSVEGDQLTALDQKLRKIENISSVTFVSRDEGLKGWMEQLGDDGTLLDWLVEDNPLQNSYRFVVRDLSQMSETLDAVRALQGVESISASYEVAQAVTGLKQAVSMGGLCVIVILAGVSLMIVANTIRLTIFNRRKEISIMKYVGATDAFIRLPFLSEGILLGAISATLAFLLLWGGYTAFGTWITQSALSWAHIVSDNFVPFRSVAVRIYLYFIGAGAGIGALGSAFFVGKYLKV